MCTTAWRTAGLVWRGSMFPSVGRSNKCALIAATERNSKMQIGMVGLGQIGSNMVRRLMKGGHECVACNRFGRLEKAAK